MIRDAKSPVHFLQSKQGNATVDHGRQSPFGPMAMCWPQPSGSFNLYTTHFWGLGILAQSIREKEAWLSLAGSGENLGSSQNPSPIEPSNCRCQDTYVLGRRDASNDHLGHFIYNAGDRSHIVDLSANHQPGSTPISFITKSIFACSKET